MATERRDSIPSQALVPATRDLGEILPYDENDDFGEEKHGEIPALRIDDEIETLFASVGIRFSGLMMGPDLREKDGDGYEALFVKFPGDTEQQLICPEYIVVLGGSESCLSGERFEDVMNLIQKLEPPMSHSDSDSDRENTVYQIGRFNRDVLIVRFLVAAIRQGILSMSTLKNAFVTGLPKFPKLVERTIEASKRFLEVQEMGAAAAAKALAVVRKK